MTPSMSIPQSPREQQRLQSLLSYEILDTANEEQLDDLTKLAASIFDVPIVLITLLDEQRQWFKSVLGLDIKETKREISFCQHTIMGTEVFEVEDSVTDARFCDNPLVTGTPFLRYYCGAPLINEMGYQLGSLALLDRKPRKLDAHQTHTLQLLAKQVVNVFELHMKRRQLEIQKSYLEEKVAQRTAELHQKVEQLTQQDKKLATANNELNRFIYKASHDLLGPLKTLQGLTELAIGEGSPEVVHHYLQMALLTERNLDAALVSLLKVISIKDPTRWVPVDWNWLVDMCLIKARKRAGEKKVQMRLEMQTDQVLLSDPSLIEIVLEELFVNSIQYNREEPISISVIISEKENAFSVLIEDNGIGIRDDKRESIFEMFYKSPRSSGSGLGLYIAKKAVEKLRGEIRVESCRNQSTTFVLRLPSGN